MHSRRRVVELPRQACAREAVLNAALSLARQRIKGPPEHGYNNKQIL